MKTIDFLPERYRQATKRRRTSYWRLIVTGLFVVAFAAAAGGLFIVERDVRRRYEHSNQLHAAAQSQQMLVASKQLELAAVRHRAELATFLRHPWPRSRLVHEALSGLPNEVTIERIRIHSTERPRTKVVEAAPLTSEEEAAKKADAEADLNELRAALEASELLVSLEGITKDQPALHVYLQSLAGSKLFTKAELTSIEALTGADDAGEAKFAVRIVVRPGWGMPGGPSAEEAEPVEEAVTRNDASAMPNVNLVGRSLP